MVRDRKTTQGPKNLTFSLLFHGRWYATGREHEVLRTSRSLSCFMGDGTRQEENVRFLEPHILSCFMGDDTRQDENVRFFEPHVLSPILWEMIHDRKRT
jgi:hypothetical protein